MEAIKTNKEGYFKTSELSFNIQRRECSYGLQNKNLQMCSTNWNRGHRPKMGIL